MKIKLSLVIFILILVSTLSVKLKKTEFPIINQDPIGFYRSHFPYLKGQVALFIQNQPSILVQLETGKTLDEKDTHIQYPIGSISKQFTAAAILSLQSQNKLNIDDLVCKYVDLFCNSEFNQITIEHLLTHRSGLPSSSVFLLTRILNALTSTGVKPSSLKAYDFLKKHMPVYLSQKPGSKTTYSNLGYIALSALIEQITHQPFHESINNLVFQPNKLNETKCLSPQEIHAKVPQPYILETDLTGESLTKEVIPFENMGEFYGAGSCISTLHDLLQWSMILQDSTLPPYGWVVDTTAQKQPWIWHNGAIYGYQSQLHRIPSSKATLIILMNLEADKLSDHLAKSILNSSKI